MTAAAPLEGLARTAALYGFALTAWLLASTALRRPVGVYQQASAIVLWLGASAVAVAHAIAVLSDGAGHQVPVTLAYAAVTVGVLPVLWPRAADERADAPAAAAEAGHDTEVGAHAQGHADGDPEGPFARPTGSADGESPYARPVGGAGVAALAAGVTVVLVLRLVAVW